MFGCWGRDFMFASSCGFVGFALGLVGVSSTQDYVINASFKCLRSWSLLLWLHLLVLQEILHTCLQAGEHALDVCLAMPHFGRICSLLVHHLQLCPCAATQPCVLHIGLRVCLIELVSWSNRLHCGVPTGFQQLHLAHHRRRHKQFPHFPALCYSGLCLLRSSL